MRPSAASCACPSTTRPPPTRSRTRTSPCWTREESRCQLSKAVFPHVKRFYANYLDGEPARQPFYGPSSRT
ncbi:hypothetical protein C1M51_06370 [Methylibium sp. Pch-M]|nr:hypothetical protein C1M51_06370 [Methylibium sp. Pch-M]